VPEKLDPRPWKELVRIGGQQRSVEPGVETKARGDAAPGGVVLGKKAQKWFQEQMAGMLKSSAGANVPASAVMALAKAAKDLFPDSAADSSSIDSIFAAADALYARSDAMQTGRWDGVLAREEAGRTTSFIKGPDGKRYPEGTTFHRIEGKVHAISPGNNVPKADW